MSKDKQWKFSGKNYLVTIAVNKYADFPELNNAIRDAQDIIETLTQLYQFDDEYTIRLFDEQATEENIYELFEQLIDKVTKEDNLIVFFSGHGHYNEKLSSGYWIPVDGRPDKTADYISNADILNILKNIKSHHLLLFVDSCFSGSLVSQLRSTKTNSERFPSRRVVASGRTEVVDDGIPGENSPFAEGILNFLRYNEEKHVDTTAMIQHVKEYVEENSKQTPIDGRVRNAGDDNGEFIFYKKITEEDLWTNAQKNNKIESYQEYLDVFPFGTHHELANAEIKRLTELRAWNRAKDNTLDDIKNYISTFPQGLFVAEARKLLEEKELKIEQHQVWLRKQAEKKLELDKIRKDFKKFIALAEIAFSSKDYENAHRHFWQSLEYYVDSAQFIPKRDYIDKKIEECNNILLYEEYKQDGKRAFKNKNWELAKEYLVKACDMNTSEDNADLLKLINASESFLNASASISIAKDIGNRKGKNSTSKALEVKKRNKMGAIQIKTRSNQKSIIKVVSKPRIQTRNDKHQAFERKRRELNTKAASKKPELTDKLVLLLVIICTLILIIIQLK